MRILAVRRVVEDGEDPSEVMRSFGLCRTTIYPWLRKFNDEGWDALVEKIAQGPEPKLNEKQRQRVKRWILGKDPRQYGFEFGLWTRRIVQTLIQEKMGIELGLTAVGRLLASLEITPQKPLRRAYERDPQAVDVWMKETYPKLRKRAKRAGAMIFFLEEAGFQSDPPLGRTYGLKGTTPVVVTSGQRQSINVISAVNACGAFWAATYTGKLNAESFVRWRSREVDRVCSRAVTHLTARGLPFQGGGRPGGRKKPLALPRQPAAVSVRQGALKQRRCS
ncbi:MAG: IS630 family transposase [Verrucomicrobia bacterium]|nr:IS630 family transposase [Verrucomicrobiota bacterium]